MRKKAFFYLCITSVLLPVFMGSCMEEKEELVIRQEESAEGAEETSKQEEIWVYVCGAVKHPGVICLKEGARIFEAVEAAGGFSQEADQQWVNQAAAVQDGEKIRIYTREETRQMMEEGISEVPQETETGDGIQNSGKININTADAVKLQEIPGIGEVRAEAILAYRAEAGDFSCIEDIQKVPGIKGKTFEKIEKYITVE